MGAELQTVIFRNDNKTDIVNEFRSMVKLDQRENGDSYSGSIGMLELRINWIDKLFSNQAEAVEYIANNQKKWELTMAVSFIDNDKKCWCVGGWCSC